MSEAISAETLSADAFSLSASAETNSPDEDLSSSSAERVSPDECLVSASAELNSSDEVFLSTSAERPSAHAETNSPDEFCHFPVFSQEATEIAKKTEPRINTDSHGWEKDQSVLIRVHPW